jgi:TonB-dependent receptor
MSRQSNKSQVKRAKRLRAAERRKLPFWLRHGATALALSTVAFDPLCPVSAQDAQGAGAGTQRDDRSAPLQEVVVTGIRQSLGSAQEIKRKAEVFVDAVTAEDIGALPDRSVTEALQRIPGVSINRFSGANDPDHFSVEGSGVVVRGLTYVRSEFNGRDAFTANNGHELSFQDVPPELLGAVEVFKNQSADMVEGGLAGTVNLRTRVPFDGKGRVFAGSLEANYGDFAEKTKPTVSALYSDRWMTGIGEVGLLLNGVYSELISRSDGSQASNFQPRTNGVAAQQVWVPLGAAFRSQRFDRKRKGGSAAAQWRSTDDSLLATLQFIRSDSTEAWTENAIETATDVVAQGSAVQPQPGTQFAFDSSGLFTNGVITQTAGWRSADSTVPLTGSQQRAQARRRAGVRHQ